MEDLISIVVLILYFVVVGAAGKNKKKKKAKKAAARKQKAQFEQAFEQISEDILSGGQSRTKEKPSLKTQRTEPLILEEGTDPCHEAVLPPQRSSIRLHPVTQEAMHAAGEGEDPCHPGSAPQEDALLGNSPVYRSPIFNTEDRDAFAQDILRGVVMSEVLTRPSCKWSGRMKRGA